MPRLPPSLIRRALGISPHAATLLPACRDLPSALNELRWIREHVEKEGHARGAAAEERARRLCQLRGRGVPLQYVLGTQPFGPLEIKCRPGVLIPRPEPEAYTIHLASLLKRGELLAGSSSQPRLSILDICTGTGCIALLLFRLLHATFPGALRVHGVDVLPAAVALARANRAHNVAAGRLPPLLSPVSSSSSSASAAAATSASPLPASSLDFHLGDMFADPATWTLPDHHRQGSDEDGSPRSSSSSREKVRRRWDVITCNPPYVSAAGFARDTARSVRNYEPRLAQVPQVPRPGYESRSGAAGLCRRPEDVFYARLLDVAARLEPRLVLCEVGGMEQAVRVVEMAAAHPFGQGGRIEVWRDSPDATPDRDEEGFVRAHGRSIAVRGSGHGRSVLIMPP